jgi:hypothetical protein
MSTSSPTITPETARHVLWTFGHEGGYQPGTFTQKLIDLLAYAPPVQMAKLALGYPVEAEAVRLAKYDEAGIDRLKTIAAGGVAA